MDVSSIISEEARVMLKVFAIIVNVIHIFIALTLFNFIKGVSRLVRTPSEGTFKFLAIVHIGLIIAILLAIIFLF